MGWPLFPGLLGARVCLPVGYGSDGHLSLTRLLPKKSPFLKMQLATSYFMWEEEQKISLMMCTWFLFSCNSLLMFSIHSKYSDLFSDCNQMLQI